MQHYVIRMLGVVRGFAADESSAHGTCKALDAETYPGFATYGEREGPMPDDLDAEAELVRDGELRARFGSQTRLRAIA